MSATLQSQDHVAAIAFARPSDHTAAPDSRDLLEPLAAQAAVIRAGRGEEVFGQGDAAEYCYVVVSGCVRSVTLTEDGRRQVNEFFLQGDLFGWDALDEYDFSAECVTEVTLRRYRRRSVEALADTDRKVGRMLRALGAGQLRAARERLMLLGRRTAAERISSFLLEMAARMQAPAQIELPMSRGDIADHLGLTIETVCRGLAQLRREGAIGLDRAKVAIRNRRALAGEMAVH